MRAAALLGVSLVVLAALAPEVLAQAGGGSSGFGGGGAAAAVTAVVAAAAPAATTTIGGSSTCSSSSSSPSSSSASRRRSSGAAAAALYADVQRAWSERDDAALERSLGTAVSELVSVEFEGTAREKALDPSLDDPRCAPDVLEVAARRAVDAWAEAIDGDDASPLEIATPEVAHALLCPYGEAQPRARVVVRGPRLSAPGDRGAAHRCRAPSAPWQLVGSGTS